MTQVGYTLYHQSRPQIKNDDGSLEDKKVGLLCKSALKVKHLKPLYPYATFEFISVLVTSGTKTVRVVVIYRPPDVSTSAFLDDFKSLLDSLFLEAAPLLLVGDFNIWMDDRTAGGTSRMLNLLAANNLTQHAVGPIHRAVNDISRKGHPNCVVFTVTEHGQSRHCYSDVSRKASPSPSLWLRQLIVTYSLYSRI